jgi:transposase-like protein
VKKHTTAQNEDQASKKAESVLDEIVREGARRLLQHAVEMEVAEYVAEHRDILGPDGHRQVVRNGWMKEREVTTGAGPIPVKRPRVHDKRPGERFTSRILPPYMRRAPSLDALIPALYLRGISTGDFQEALEAILGPQAKGLSATNIVRLKEIWKQEYDQWRQQDLSEKHYVYVWADGVYFNVRLDDQRSCILVLMGATKDGEKELLAVHDGYRESKLSWSEMLSDLKTRGLKSLPALAVGDGGLGFWAALREQFPTVREQRCWVHKTANILDKMPKGVQSKAKQQIHDMYMAETKAQAMKAYEQFLRLYKAKYPRACECLEKDKEVLFTFYDFPAEHWIHLRTTNPIESTFATVRHRTRRTKGCGSRAATLTMVYKLASEAEKHWRRLNSPKLILKLIEGFRFVDGIMQEAA